MTVSADDIRAAHTRISDGIERTPLVHSRTLSDICGAEIWLKLENLQYTASFKDRGALNKLLSLDDREKTAGVVAASAGNHAQAVAWHAARLGIDATIVMPVSTPLVKVTNTEKLGARIVLHGEGVGEAASHAAGIAAETGAALVHPYDDDAIIAGQGTAALEILAENPAIETLVIPVGGGGLIAGCAIAAKDINQDIDIVGVETVMYPSMHAAVFGETDRLTGGVSIADGISVKSPGERTRPVVKELVTRIDLVREEDIETAIHLFAEIEKQVVEGAGATRLAAILAYPKAFAGKRVALVVSGGNIDTRLLSSVLMRGLVRTGRLVRLGIQIGDLPGNLARVTDLIAGLGGNIIEVEHERWYRDVPVRMAQIEILVEVRNDGDGHSIAEGLADAGFPTRLLGTDYAPS
ncbi:MAG: threonine ammonia-lyase [Alphaproteobacteria bacterium]